MRHGMNLSADRIKTDCTIFVILSEAKDLLWEALDY